MNLEVGMYVRTKRDGIGRIISLSIGEDDDCCFIELSNRRTGIKKHNLVKEPSHNIIDLIEENDYIRIITSAYFEPVYYSYGKLVIRDDIPIENYSNDFVREVITKEQFEAMAYKVGE